MNCFKSPKRHAHKNEARDDVSAFCQARCSAVKTTRVVEALAFDRGLRFGFDCINTEAEAPSDAATDSIKGSSTLANFFVLGFGSGGVCSKTCSGNSSFLDCFGAFFCKFEDAIDDTQQATDDNECEADDNVGRHKLEPKRLRTKWK